MSLLIGVNDVWHEIAEANGVATAKFEKILTMLFEEILEELPDIKVMMLEPFVLRGPDTDDTEDKPDRYSQFLLGVKEKAEAVKRVADKFNFKFIPLQDKFNEAAKTTESPTYWLVDGVHPTAAGHELIKREWLKAFEEL